MDDRVERGISLLAHLEIEELTLAETVDRIETITSDPAVVRTILDEAVVCGVIERTDGNIRPQRTRVLEFDEDVITKDGEFSCRRCGAGLETGYFITFEAGEVGPFGSTCIRKVTGRE